MTFRSRTTLDSLCVAIKPTPTIWTGLNVRTKPTYPRGYFHFIDFTDMEHPKEVARYELPEAGSHNLWVEDDVLYVAY